MQLFYFYFNFSVKKQHIFNKRMELNAWATVRILQCYNFNKQVNSSSHCRRAAWHSLLWILQCLVARRRVEEKRKETNGEREHRFVRTLFQNKVVLFCKGLILFGVLMQQVFVFQMIKAAIFIVFLERCFRCPFQDLGEKQVLIYKAFKHAVGC